MAQKDFDVDSLAAHLHITPQQVEKLASRDKIPGRRVGGQWRFPEAEIHHWLEDRIGLADDAELADLEGMFERHAATAVSQAEPQTVSLVDKLPPEAIDLTLSARSPGKVITAMVELAMKTGLLWDPDKMAEAVAAREAMHPTALDNGVALLHPRRPMPAILGGPALALGRVSAGVPFGGSGGVLTDLFFLICSVDDRRHLRVLARLSRLISDPTFLEDLRAAGAAQEVREAIRTREAAIEGE